MNLSEVEPQDWDVLYAAWPDAVTCPRWRLLGEAPSPGMFQHLVTTGLESRVIRRGGGEALGLVQVCAIDAENGYGSLGYMLRRPCSDLDEPVGRYLREACAGLRKIVVPVEGDVLEDLAGVVSDLHQVGCLMNHSLHVAERYLDRFVYEFHRPATADSDSGEAES